MRTCATPPPGSHVVIELRRAQPVRNDRTAVYCTVKMSSSKPKASGWVKIASKSKPGEVYYCNKHTKKCTWTPPPEFQESDKVLRIPHMVLHMYMYTCLWSTTCVPQIIAKSAKNAPKEQQDKEQKESGQMQKTRAEKPKPLKLNLQSNINNNGNVERAASVPPPIASGMDKQMTFGQPLASANSGSGESSLTC